MKCRHAVCVVRSSMTAPRAVLPGTTYMLSRRTTRRYFLLRPDADGTMQQILLYTLAATAKELGIDVHCIAGMSTHPHEDIGVIVLVIRRPDVYFDPNNPRWPEEIELPIPMPKPS